MVGKPMQNSVDEAKNYMLGYTNTHDISDREACDPDTWGFDALISKGRDSSKPVGPFIVPQEFVDPLNMRLKMTVGGKLVQDYNTNQARHSLYEYGAYRSLTAAEEGSRCRRKGGHSHLSSWCCQWRL